MTLCGRKKTCTAHSRYSNVTALGPTAEEFEEEVAVELAVSTEVAGGGAMQRAARRGAGPSWKALCKMREREIEQRDVILLEDRIWKLVTCRLGPYLFPLRC